MKLRLSLAMMLAVLSMAAASAAHAQVVTAVDHDGDGFDDATELANGYSPFGSGKLSDNDADADGLSDADELAFGTDPLLADTDNDGFLDGVEVTDGYDPTVGDGAKLKKRIVITLSTQTLKYYLGPREVGAFKVSSGKASTPTPVGTYAIRDKKPRAWSAAAKLWMPYWMPFIGTTYGLHELPEWPNGFKEGVGHLGTPVSHGCVRLGVGAAKTLYEWAEIGTEVDIRKT